MQTLLAEPKTQSIQLKHLFHRGEKCIAIIFNYNEELIQSAKQIPGVRWSSTKRCWYIKNNKENLTRIFNVFKGKSYVNADALFTKKDAPVKINWKKSKKAVPKINISEEAENALTEFTNYLKSKRYSTSAINTYPHILKRFFSFYKDKKLDEITNEDIIKYNNDFIIKYKYSISYQRQLIGAIKLLYEKRDKRTLVLEDLERPRREKNLPDVLSEEEIIKMIQVTKNLKHRCLIALQYSAGLRISEVLNLKLKDIDSDRNLIKICSGKGRKDRYVPLSTHLLPLLRNYYMTYSPKSYLFEGQSGDKYSAGSVRSIIKTACKRSGILKNVTPHTLRHSYATHLMENGIDTRFVQNFLGHNSIKTTMIYTHIKSQATKKILSPLDYAIQKKLGKDKSKEIEENLRLSTPKKAIISKKHAYIS